MIKDLDLVRSLYYDEPIVKNTGSTRIFNEVDGETYGSNMPEGADATKARTVMGYTKTMTKVRRGKEIDITFQMRDENRYTDVIQKLTSLSTFNPQRLAIDLTHRLTFSTATSYVDMDGQTVDTTVGDTLALVSAVHTLTGTSTTYSNVITGNPSFSKGAFQVARYQADTQILNNFGDQRVMEFDTVVTGTDPATVDAVKVLIQSQTDPTQNNPGVVNTYANMFSHVALKRLATTATGARDATKDKYWGYLATGGDISTRWDARLGIWEENNLKVPAPGNNGENIHNDNWTYGCRMGYGIVTVSAKGFLWSTGLGS